MVLFDLETFTILRTYKGPSTQQVVFSGANNGAQVNSTSYALNFISCISMKQKLSELLVSRGSQKILNGPLVLIESVIQSVQHKGISDLLGIFFIASLRSFSTTGDEKLRIRKRKA
jgi:hypothetical protein